MFLGVLAFTVELSYVTVHVLLIDMIFRKCFERRNGAEQQPPACGFVLYHGELVGWAGGPRMAMTHGKGASSHRRHPGQLFPNARSVVGGPSSKLDPFWDTHGLLISQWQI